MAKDAPKGRNFSLYISGEDLALIQMILADRGEDSSEKACIELARKAAQSGIYQLLIAKKSESNETLQQALRETVDKLFAMVREPSYQVMSPRRMKGLKVMNELQWNSLTGNYEAQTSEGTLIVDGDVFAETYPDGMAEDRPEEAYSAETWLNVLDGERVRIQ